MARQGSLIPSTPEIEGFLYRDEFITAGEELDLLNRIRSLDFHEMKMRGVIARRRVIHYGVKYSFETFKASEGPPIPPSRRPRRRLSRPAPRPSGRVPAATGRRAFRRTSRQVRSR